MSESSLPSIDPLDQISPNRAMVIFGIGRQRMGELIESGQVPAIRIGKKRRKISIKALRAALGTTAPSQAA